MKRSIGYHISRVARFAILVVVVLSACSSSGNDGSSGGTLTLSLHGAPVGANGKTAYFGVFSEGANAGSAPLLAMGSIALVDSAIVSFVLEDPATSNPKVLSDGTYDLYLWIDMNDSGSAMGPEDGIDMAYGSFPVPVTVYGDTSVAYFAAGFELYTDP